MSLRLLWSFVCLGLVNLTILGCSQIETKESTAAQDQAAFCINVARTRNSLASVRDALLPLDEAAMREARAGVRADIDYLEGSAYELQGGSNAVGVLKEDLVELEAFVSGPSLVTASDDIRAQLGIVMTNLDGLEELGNCP